MAFSTNPAVVGEVRFENVFTPGRYFVTPAVAHQAGMWIDRREQMATIVVTGTRASDALVDLPYQVLLERASGRLVDVGIGK